MKQARNQIVAVDKSTDDDYRISENLVVSNIIRYEFSPQDGVLLSVLLASDYDQSLNVVRDLRTRIDNATDESERTSLSSQLKQHPYANHCLPETIAEAVLELPDRFLNAIKVVLLDDTKPETDVPETWNLCAEPNGFSYVSSEIVLCRPRVDSVRRDLVHQWAHLNWYQNGPLYDLLVMCFSTDYAAYYPGIENFGPSEAYANGMTTLVCGTAEEKSAYMNAMPADAWMIGRLLNETNRPTPGNKIFEDSAHEAIRLCEDRALGVLSKAMTGADEGSLNLDSFVHLFNNLRSKSQYEWRERGDFSSSTIGSWSSFPMSARRTIAAKLLLELVPEFFNQENCSDVKSVTINSVEIEQPNLRRITESCCNLETLDLAGSALIDHLVHPLPCLRRLNLSGVERRRVDYLLDDFSKCKNLEVLDLSNLGIDRFESNWIPNPDSLRRLNLAGNQLSADTIENLKSSLPNCEILI